MLVRVVLVIAIVLMLASAGLSIRSRYRCDVVTWTRPFDTQRPSPQAMIKLRVCTPAGRLVVLRGFESEYLYPPVLQFDAIDPDVPLPSGKLGFAFETEPIGSYGNTWFVVIPLWSFVLLFGGVALFATWRLRRRVDAHGRRVCVECGYDLRSTPERCPECGHIVEEKA